jgi:SAM-dependent methyltransferase
VEIRPGAASDEDLLADQRVFYRRRAPEYDEWWQRRGRYDHGPDDARDWHDQVAQLAAALEDFRAGGDVLELAGGTGWWTQPLAETAKSLTVLDASPEALELNRERVARPDVEYVVADLFSWQPERAYDVVFFSFWLSHVPRARFHAFWALVGSCLNPGGRVFFIDNRRDPTLNRPDPYVFDERDDVQRRRLSDGSEHRVVKVFYEATQLADRLAAEGWQAHVASTRGFIYGTAQPG